MTTCFHCGDPCIDTHIVHHEKSFCCHGCKTVYEILNENNLDYYYTLEQAPGSSPKEIEGRFDFLDNQDIVEKLVEFNDATTQIVSFVIPTIHCSSCIWVLENLNKLDEAIQNSQVNFPEKTIRITYSSEKTTLKKIVVLLSKLGYEPTISLENSDKKEKTHAVRVFVCR